MRSEGGVADGAAGVPSEAETGTVEPMVAVESVSCVELLDRGVDCAIVVAAARASAEPVAPSMSMATTEAKTVPAADEIDPRPAQSSAAATEAETQATNLPGEAESRQSLYVARVCENRENR